MLRYGSPQLGGYRSHRDRGYVAPWVSKNRSTLLGLGQVTEQPELRTLPWQIDAELDPGEARAEKWSNAATVVGIVAGLASVAAILGWVR